MRNLGLSAKETKAYQRVVGLSVVVAVGLWFCSNLRHSLFHSTAMDLGFFDQAVYLISQGEVPVVSFWGHHALGDHAAYNLYVLAGLYRLLPDARLLLALQAISLALAGGMVWGLARQRGMAEPTATTLAVAFWLYPLVFNVNLFDFHPEVMAVPALLAGVWLARERWGLGWFTAAVLFVLGCKAVLSLTVVAMGVWLWGFEKRRRYGMVALGLGLVWFVVSTKLVIPLFRPDGVEAVYRYNYLGESVGEILRNLLLKPQLFWGKLLSGESWLYLGMLVFPVVWGLSLRGLAPLVVALPTLAVNLLAEHPLQRSLEHQYALPILPFLFVAVVDSVAIRGGKLGFVSRRGVLAWCLVGLLWLGNPNKLLRGLTRLDTWQATREAIALVPPEAKVLTDNYLAPHLTHRTTVLLVGHPSPRPIDLETPNYIVFNARYPWGASVEVVRDLVMHFRNHPEFELRYQRDDVFVFARTRTDSEE